MTPDQIRAEFETARAPPAEALREGAQHADALLSPVLDVLNKAIEGVYLLPEQDGLLFYGVHALAAARRSELYRPFLNLLRCPEDELERLFGLATTESVPQILISVFDGDLAPLAEAIEDRTIDEYIRWTLFDVLVWLAIDGTVPRDAAISIIDRFERERLADDGDAAWKGWQDAVMLLGLAELAPRVRASWEDGRNPEPEVERQDWEHELDLACAEPGNLQRFADRRLAPLDDPVAALSWMRAESVPESEADAPQHRDPAAESALSEAELDWLAGFLESRQVAETTMSMEQLDGFFTALVIGPETILPSVYLPLVWGGQDGDGPVYDSVEQAQYVLGLLMRHWNSIGQRLSAGDPHVPLILDDPQGEHGRVWAIGFMRGLVLCMDAWKPLVRDEGAQPVLDPILSLALADDERAEIEVTPEMREKALELLPSAIPAIYLYWRRQEREAPRPSPVRAGRKIGRNERCPCGSGRKYKVCCGSPTAPPDS